MKKLLIIGLLGLGLLQARDVNLAWDYEEELYQSLTGFEITAARNQGDLFSVEALTIAVTVEASDDNISVEPGIVRGFATVMDLPAGVWYLACRAYVIHEGVGINGEVSNVIRVVVTPGRVILRLP